MSKKPITVMSVGPPIEQIGPVVVDENNPPWPKHCAITFPHRASKVYILPVSLATEYERMEEEVRRKKWR